MSTEKTKRERLSDAIAAALNCHSAENGSDTPDFVLADYLLGCLDAWDAGVTARERWYGRDAGGGASLGELARHPAGASTTTPPEGATRPSGPAAPVSWLTYDPEDGWDEYPTEAAGRHALDGLLDDHRDAEYIHEDVESVALWRCIRVAHVRQTVTATSDDDTPAGQSCRDRGWDFLAKLDVVGDPGGADEAAGLRAALADAELRVALWSGAPVEGWERESAENGGGYRRTVGGRSAHLYFFVDVGAPWFWVGSEPAGWVRERGSDPDPLVCLRAAEAWLSEVGNG